MKFGETVPEAAMREATEETGLDLRFEQICGVATEVIRQPQSQAEAHFIMFIVLLSTQNRAYTSSHEGELKWTEIDELDNPNIIPSDRAMIKRYVLGNRKVEMDHFIVERTGNSFTLLP